MSYEDCLARARQDLQTARKLLQDDIQAYPTPISGCDAQYNYLIGLRSSLSDAIEALEGPRFVATPRTPELGAGVESR